MGRKEMKQKTLVGVVTLMALSGCGENYVSERQTCLNNCAQVYECDSIKSCPDSLKGRFLACKEKCFDLYPYNAGLGR